MESQPCNTISSPGTDVCSGSVQHLSHKGPRPQLGSSQAAAQHTAMSVPAWGKPLFYGDISGTGSAGGTLDTGALPDLGRQPERLGRNRGITYSTTHFLFLKIYKNTCIYLYNPRFFVAHLPQAHYQLSLFKITLFYTNRPL